MLDCKPVEKYIENKNNIKLTKIQKRILKAIIRGDKTYIARGTGRSLLYNGYADYLKDVVAKDTDRTLSPDEFDSVFTLDMFEDDDYFRGDTFSRWTNLFIVNRKMFDKDFMCKF